MRRDDVVVEICQRWGNWRLNGGIAQSEGDILPRAPGEHSDPTYTEYVAIHAQGYGLLAHVDRLVREMHIPHQRIMLRRYVSLYTLAAIADEMKIETYIVRDMHARCLATVTPEIVRYVLVGTDRDSTEMYRRDILAA